MGRGDNDLLFNPPLIRKPDPGIRRGASGAFSSAIESLWTTANFTMAWCDNGQLHFLNDDMVPTNNIVENSSVNRGNIFTVSDMGIAWGGDEGFIIRNFANKNAPSVFKLAPPGKVLGLQIAAGDLWALAEEESGEELRLFRSPIDLVDAGWMAEDSRPSWNNTEFLSKGENSLLLSQDKVNQRNGLITISHSGASGQLDIADNNLLEGQKQGSLIAPLGKNDQYFALGERDGQVTLLLLAPKRPGIRILGRAQEGRIASLDNCQSTVFYEMQSHLGRGLLLGDKELILFDGRGIIETIPLNPTLDKGYDRLNFTSDKAVLWSAGNPNYQEILLPKRRD